MIGIVCVVAHEFYRHRDNVRRTHVRRSTRRLHGDTCRADRCPEPTVGQLHFHADRRSCVCSWSAHHSHHHHYHRHLSCSQGLSNQFSLSNYFRTYGEIFYCGFCVIQLFMVALLNRADHIYFHAVVCSFLFFSSPNHMVWP